MTTKLGQSFCCIDAGGDQVSEVLWQIGIQIVRTKGFCFAWEWVRRALTQIECGLGVRIAPEHVLWR